MSEMLFVRHAWTQLLAQRLRESPQRLQILLGPRQVGKTTALQQLAAEFGGAVHSASADDQQRMGALWIEQEWARARRLLVSYKTAYLFLDEIQKIQNWSETVKKLWDEDRKQKLPLHTVLTGSSSLSIQSGLSESLAGRFEMVPALHGSWPEFRQLCGKSLDHYIFFGGYPGSLSLLGDEARWRSFVNVSIIEAVLSRDILLLARVDKPALLRQLFHLGCEFSGQILSYQKALGQLQDAGNTTTLAHYLELLDQAFLLKGLQQFDPSRVRRRASSPKFQVHNSALTAALGLSSFEEARERPEEWGHLVESAVGAYLLNQARKEGFELSYWRERNAEVDFVVSAGKRKVLAIEVKSGRRGKVFGLQKFREKYPFAKALVLQTGDGSLEEFFASSPLAYF